jgi:hypothetical protein
VSYHMDTGKYEPLVFAGLPVHVTKDRERCGQPDLPGAVTLVPLLDHEPSTPEQGNDTAPMLYFDDREALVSWARTVLAQAMAPPWCSCGDPDNPEIPRGQIGRCPVHDPVEGFGA